jgi:hypothetical protein
VLLIDAGSTIGAQVRASVRSDRVAQVTEMMWIGEVRSQNPDVLTDFD